MKIVAFLGNPEKKYLKTRHNIGFIIGDDFAASAGISSGKKMFQSRCGTGKVKGTDVCLLFPETYMNSSGDAVALCMAYFRETPANLIVVHDEIEMPFGEFNARFGGGHRGHNGLRSIMARTGSPDFHRLRFGVGRPANPAMTVADHVLSDFLPEELARIRELMPKIHEILLTLIAGQEAPGPGDSR